MSRKERLTSKLETLIVMLKGWRSHQKSKIKDQRIKSISLEIKTVRHKIKITK